LPRQLTVAALGLRRVVRRRGLLLKEEKVDKAKAWGRPAEGGLENLGEEIEADGEERKEQRKVKMVRARPNGN